MNFDPNQSNFSVRSTERRTAVDMRRPSKVTNYQSINFLDANRSRVGVVKFRKS